MRLIYNIHEGHLLDQSENKQKIPSHNSLTLVVLFFFEAVQPWGTREHVQLDIFFVAFLSLLSDYKSEKKIWVCAKKLKNNLLIRKKMRNKDVFFWWDFERFSVRFGGWVENLREDVDEKVFGCERDLENENIDKIGWEVSFFDWRFEGVKRGKVRIWIDVGEEKRGRKKSKKLS